MRTYNNYSLLRHNTFGIDVSTRYFVEYDTESELQELLKSDLLRENKTLSVGAGSNLLFLDDFKGVILHSCILGIEQLAQEGSSIYLRVGAGVVWDDLVAYCVQNQYYGMENLSLIPGEVGAAPVQNIGAYGVEAKDLITKVECVELSSGNKKIFSNKDCEFSYRGSVFKRALKGKYIVTHVHFNLQVSSELSINYGSLALEVEKQGALNLTNVRKAIIAVREAKLPDPKNLGNAGSFFMNPVIGVEQFKSIQKDYPGVPHYLLSESAVKIPAGWLIEQCGWKGESLGPVGVHHLQALVLINRGGATGTDVVRLSDAICNSVREKFEIVISPEVNFIEG